MQPAGAFAPLPLQQGPLAAGMAAMHLRQQQQGQQQGPGQWQQEGQQQGPGQWGAPPSQLPPPPIAFGQRQGAPIIRYPPPATQLNQGGGAYTLVGYQGTWQPPPTQGPPYPQPVHSPTEGSAVWEAGSEWGSSQGGGSSRTGSTGGGAAMSNPFVGGQAGQSGGGGTQMMSAGSGVGVGGLVRREATKASDATRSLDAAFQVWQLVARISLSLSQGLGGIRQHAILPITISLCILCCCVLVCRPASVLCGNWGWCAHKGGCTGGGAGCVSMWAGPCAGGCWESCAEG